MKASSASPSSRLIGAARLMPQGSDVPPTHSASTWVVSVTRMHVADADLGRQPRELQAAGAAAARLDEASAHQDRHDLGDVDIR